MAPREDYLKNKDTDLPKAVFKGGPSTIKIWNQFNSGHLDRGTKNIAIVLFKGEKVVERKEEIEIPWKPGEDTFVDGKTDLQFDRLRVEVLEVCGPGGGLIEVQVWSSDKNLALGAGVAASAYYTGDNRDFPPSRINDNITTSREFPVGYWLLPDGEPGWIELDFSKMIRR